MIEKIICFIVGELVCIIFLSLFSAAHDADKQQETVYDEDKLHSRLLEED